MSSLLETVLCRFQRMKNGKPTKGFLASKSKPVFIPFRRACGPVRVGRGGHSTFEYMRGDREDPNETS